MHSTSALGSCSVFLVVKLRFDEESSLYGVRAVCMYVPFAVGTCPSLSGAAIAMAPSGK